MIIYAVEVAGWLGAICVLAAYMLLSTGKLTSRSVAFHWLNIIGAAGFIVNTAWHNAIPSMALNVVWLGIGAWALWRISAST
ncbi:MAG: hypothetical protein ABI395_10710 [Sphingobium sp.]